ncbi:4Fe-4S binding protein, partial [Myxococcota bacterium]|nr:4Fe-4S binding protein [Myxococcota bacterium]
ASYVATVGVVVAGTALGLQADSIRDIWDWIMMSVGAAVVVPNVLRWYWWRLNGTGYAVGTLVGIVASLVLLGILHNYQLSLVDLGLATTGIFPSAFPKTMLLLAALGLAVLAGPLWCSFLCPVGALQELIHVVARLVRGRFRDWRTVLACAPNPLDVKNRWVQAAGFLKYVVLAGALTGFAITLNQRFLSWDPLSYLFALPWQALHYHFIAAGIVLSSVFTYRPYCRFFCPLGAAFLLLGRFAPLARFFPVRILRTCDFGAHSARDISCIRCQRCCRKK